MGLLDFFFGNGDLERLLEGLRVSGLRVLDLLRLLVLDLLFFDFSPGDLDLVGLILFFPFRRGRLSSSRRPPFELDQDRQLELSGKNLV